MSTACLDRKSKSGPKADGNERWARSSVVGRILALDWTSGNPGVLLGLLVASYPDSARHRSGRQGRGRRIRTGIGPRRSGDGALEQVLRRGAGTQQIPALMRAVLADQAANEKRPVFCQPWGEAFLIARAAWRGPHWLAAAVTSAGAGLGDAIAGVQAMMNLMANSGHPGQWPAGAGGLASSSGQTYSSRPHM